MTDRGPTFAEALLASAVVAIAADKQNGITWKRARQIARDALDGAAPWVEPVPKEIRRALGVDKQPDTEFDGLPMGRLISMLSDAKAGRPISKSDADAMGGWINSHALGVDKPHGDGGEWWEREERSRSKIAALESQLAAAVARAEKSEEQMRHDSDARRLAEAGRVSAVEAMCAIERARDSLRAELDKAKAELDQAKAYNSAAYKNGVVSVRAADATGRSNDCQAWLQACLHAEAERDALAAKLREAEDAAQSYWLIELSPSCYLTAAGCLIPKFTWTAEYDSALKFQSKTEADQVLTAIRNLVPSLFPENLPTCARPTEHAWIAARKALDAKEQP